MDINIYNKIACTVQFDFLHVSLILSIFHICNQHQHQPCAWCAFSVITGTTATLQDKAPCSWAKVHLYQHSVLHHVFHKPAFSPGGCGDRDSTTYRPAGHIFSLGVYRGAVIEQRNKSLNHYLRMHAQIIIGTARCSLFNKVAIIIRSIFQVCELHPMSNNSTKCQPRI